MTVSLADPQLWVLAAAAASALAGGLVKGAVGFGLPMVALGTLGAFLSAQDAIALLLLPSAASNLLQMFRQGWRAFGETFARFWRLNLSLAVVIALSAQLVPRIESDTLFVILGVTVSAAALMQLADVSPGRRDMRHRGWVETGVGAAAGLLGGVTGVWGPPILLYITTLGIEKRMQVRMLGLNFGTGWVVLTLAHLKSGVLNAATLPLSAALLVPAMAGMVLGAMVQDRLDPKTFRRATLIILCLAGLNLLRRGLG